MSWLPAVYTRHRQFGEVPDGSHFEFTIITVFTFSHTSHFITSNFFTFFRTRGSTARQLFFYFRLLDQSRVFLLLPLRPASSPLHTFILFNKRVLSILSTLLLLKHYVLILSISYSSNSVSYTHLDVYKRQVYVCVCVLLQMTNPYVNSFTVNVSLLCVCVCVCVCVLCKLFVHQWIFESFDVAFHII